MLTGHVQSRVVYYLMNIHVLPRTIYITRVCYVIMFARDSPVCRPVVDE